MEHAPATQAGVQGPPNAGVTAWLQVLGGYLIFFNSWGIVNTFAAYEDFFQTTLLPSYNSSLISWIGTVQAFLLMGLSIISGPIFDRGYFRLLISLGSFLTVFGVMMTSLATEYYQVILAQGVCVGIGGGFLFVTSVAIVSTYFDTKRALAVGIMASGGSIGSVIYPIVFRQLQPKIGFAWTTRVIGFIALGTLLVAIMIMRTRLPPPKKTRPMADFTAFKNMPYTIFSTGLFLSFTGLYIPIFYIVSYARSMGIDTDLSFYLLSILNAGSAFGRVIPGLIADKYGALETIIICTLASALLGYIWLTVHSLAGLVVVSIIYGFTSGAVVSLQATVVASLVPEISMIGTWMGMSLFMGGIGILIGSPISGAIANSSSGFSGALIFAASFTVAGGLRLPKHHGRDAFRVRYV